MSGTIGDGQRAAIKEACTAASRLIPESSRKSSFIAIGGAAILHYGGSRKTLDVDFAITTETLDAFDTAAANTAHFKYYESLKQWEYSCQGPSTKDITVTFDFLLIGGEQVSRIRATEESGHAYVASITDLALLKAIAYMDDPSREKDLGDFKFCIRKMIGKKVKFVDLNEEEDDALKYITKKLDAEDKMIMAELRKKK